jgi:hypothetical protein
MEGRQALTLQMVVQFHPPLFILGYIGRENYVIRSNGFFK